MLNLRRRVADTAGTPPAPMRRLAVAFALVAPLPLAAQTATPWSVRVATEAEALEGGRGTWQQQSVALGRKFSRGAVVLEGGRVVRYGQAEAYGAVEAYPWIAEKTYGYARVRLSPDARVSPRLDAHAEVYRAVARGFELSVGARRMHFANAAVTMATSGATLDRGPWQLGLRGSVVASTDFTGSGAVRLRRTFRDNHAFFAEASVGAGRELVATGSGTAAFGPTRVAAVRASVPAGRGVVVEAGATVTHESGFTRAGGTVGVGVRF